MNSKPPYGPFLLQKNGFGSAVVLVKKADLQGSETAGNDSMRGYFTVGVKSSEDTRLSIFWNNTPNEDIFELTPGHPATLYSTEYRE